MRHHLLISCAVALCVTALMAAKSKSSKHNKMTTAPTADATVLMRTSMGDITIRLYGDTPRHTANFLKLAEEGYYNGTLFHRVINEFMIQGGDPQSKNAKPGQALGMGDPDYKIEAEFVYPKYFHKYGALAAAREGDRTNPAKASSGSQFYIVTGRKFTDAQLDQMQKQMQHRQMQSIFDSLAMQHRDSIMTLRRERNRAALQELQDSLVKQTEAIAAKHPATFTPEQRQAYTTVGGAPHLDGDYTVFGEVISGMDVVDSIQKVATDSSDRPEKDVKVTEIKILDK